jgi:hypothetical protein
LRDPILNAGRRVTPLDLTVAQKRYLTCRIKKSRGSHPGFVPQAIENCRWYWLNILPGGAPSALRSSSRVLSKVAVSLMQAMSHCIVEKW